MTAAAGTRPMVDPLRTAEHLRAGSVSTGVLCSVSLVADSARKLSAYIKIRGVTLGLRYRMHNPHHSAAVGILIRDS